MKDEYIRKEDAVNSLKQRKREPWFLHKDLDWDNGVAEAISDIEDIEPADVAPVVHGRWIPYRCDMYECSVCQHIHTSFDSEECDAYYCPHCGAKMEKSEQDGSIL